MLLIAAVSLWCWAGLWRVKRAREYGNCVQSEFVESRICEASHWLSQIVLNQPCSEMVMGSKCGNAI
jgi:hypothetical protein